MKLKKLLLGAVLSTTVLAASQAGATSISIVNHSFEQDVLPVFDGNVGWQWGISGWNTNNVGLHSGVWHPSGAFLPAPDGVNVAFSMAQGSSGIIQQTLSAVLMNNATYTLGVDVGLGSDSLYQSYALELLAGNNVIASISNPVAPGSNSYSHATLSFTSGANMSEAGQLLGIRIVTTPGGVGGAQNSYDNVTLNVTSVPEPETYSMLMAGLGLLGFMARRKQQKQA